MARTVEVRIDQEQTSDLRPLALPETCALLSGKLEDAARQGNVFGDAQAYAATVDATVAACSLRLP